MEGFGGTVYHQVDEKGRVRIPAKFLSKSASGAKVGEEGVYRYSFMAGANGCISVYLERELNIRLERLNEIPDRDSKTIKSKRKILGSIEDVETDKQGRVVIPPTLRQYANINKELVSVGVGDHFEIWAKEVFERVNMDVSYESAYDTVGFF